MNKIGRIIAGIGRVRQKLVENFLADGFPTDEAEEEADDCVSIPGVRQGVNDASQMGGDDVFNSLRISELRIWDYDASVITFGPKSKRTELAYRTVCSKAIASAKVENGEVVCLGPSTAEIMLVWGKDSGVCTLDIESQKWSATGMESFGDFLLLNVEIALGYYSMFISVQKHSSNWKDAIIGGITMRGASLAYLENSLSRRPRPT